MKYKYIIFDADDTLVDYDADSQRSFRAALAAVGRERDEELFARWIEFDYGNWDKIGLSDVHLPAIQAAYHDLYRRHVVEIFAHGAEITGDRTALAEAEFLAEFARPGIEVEGAHAVVEALKARGYRVYAATNGLTSLQRTRLAEFPLDGVFISEEIGTIKPDVKYFMHILDALGAAPSECLMVGDSLSSDIAGAAAAGLDSVWLNRRKKPCPAGMTEIVNISEILELV